MRNNITEVVDRKKSPNEPQESDLLCFKPEGN